jgi:hypothetical protein
MTTGGALLAVLDRAHTPPPGHKRLAKYKEWWHLNIIDEHQGLDLIVNLSLNGDIHSAGQGRAYRILIAHEHDFGWTSDLSQREGIAVSAGDEALELDLEGISFVPDGQALKLSIDQDSAQRIYGELEFLPQADPMMIWKNTTLGDGRINWFLVPDLLASGHITIEGRTYVLDNARSYHDHNWGHWLWGDNFGWEWGFAAAISQTSSGPLSFVYDRTSDKGGMATVEHSIGIWKGAELACFFSRRDIRLTRIGAFDRAVQRIPGISHIVDDARVVGIPKEIRIRAESGADWIDAIYRPQDVLQIAIPSELGRGLTELNETMGDLLLMGQIGSETISAHGRACFEFVS